MFKPHELQELTEQQIRSDNPHFGPVIRLVEEGAYLSRHFDYTYFLTVGARDSKIDWSLIQDGSDIRTMDAWATYLWSPSKQHWDLGAN